MKSFSFQIFYLSLIQYFFIKTNFNCGNISYQKIFDKNNIFRDRDIHIN